MKSQWKGEAYKNALWNCATATTLTSFTRRMGELKELKKEAYIWLNKIPAEHWSRSHFSGNFKCFD